MKFSISPRSASYRWVIVATVTVCLLNIYGVRHSFSAYLPPILDEFGWARGSTSFIMSLNILLYGLCAPFAGNLIERWRPKRVIVSGITILAISTIGCAFAQELWHFYVLYGVFMAAGGALAGVPVLIPAVANWFSKGRGFAIGLAYVGGGLSFSMAMYASFLISHVGWRSAYLIMTATMVGIAVPLILIFFKFRPERGTAVGNGDTDGAWENSKKNVHSAVSPFGHLHWTQMLKNHRLWLLVLCQSLYMGIAGYMVLTHQVIYAEDLGYSSLFAASVAGIVGLCVAIGNLAGFVTDRVGREKVHTFSTVVMVVGIIVLIVQNDASNPWAMYLYAVCFGSAMGIMAPCITAGAADLFHGRYFGVVNGMMLAGMGVGGVIGPWLGGYIFDVTGNYTIAFSICIGAYITSCISLWVAAPRNAALMAEKMKR